MRCHLKQLCREYRIGPEEIGDPPGTNETSRQTGQDRAETLSQRKRLHLSGLCPEGHTDAELPRPESGDVRQNAINADGGQRDTEAGEEREHQQIESSLRIAWA